MRGAGPWMIVAVWTLVACAGAREDSWRALWASQARWYVVAWGSEPDLLAVGQARARFDCIWDGLEGSGTDPAADLGCWARRIDRAATCLGGGQETGDPAALIRRCMDEGDAVCAVSAPYLDQARRCRRAAP